MTSVKENPLVEVPLVSPQPADEANSTILAELDLRAGQDGGLHHRRRRALGHRAGPAGQATTSSSARSSAGRCARPAATGKFTVATDVKDEQVRVVVTALDKNDEFLNFLDMCGDGPGARPGTSPERPEQTAPGRYVGSFPAGERAATSSRSAPGRARRRSRTGVNVPYSDEFRDRATNEALLDRAGRLVPKGGAGRAGNGRSRPRKASRTTDTLSGGQHLPPRPAQGHQQPGHLVLSGPGRRAACSSSTSSSAACRSASPGCGPAGRAETVSPPPGRSRRRRDDRAAAEPQGRGGRPDRPVPRDARFEPSEGDHGHDRRPRPAAGRADRPRRRPRRPTRSSRRKRKATPNACCGRRRRCGKSEGKKE